MRGRRKERGEKREGSENKCSCILHRMNGRGKECGGGKEKKGREVEE